MNFIYFIIIGAIAGWLAGKIMAGGGFGLAMNMLLGIIGGLVGGWVFGLFGISTDGGLLGSLVTALVGSVLILYVGRLIKK